MILLILIIHLYKGVVKFDISKRERHHALNDAFMIAKVFIKVLDLYD